MNALVLPGFPLGTVLLPHGLLVDDEVAVLAHRVGGG